MSDVVETFEVAINDAVFDDLRLRIERTRWPIQPDGLGWEHGGDVGYLRELCEHWASAYDPRRLEQILNRFENRRAGGLHFIHEHAPRSDGGQALLLIHGWPGGPHEFSKLIPRLTAAGHDVIVPSLPGYGFSDQPAIPLNVAGMAERLRVLMVETLGYERFAVQGGDWGSIIGARIAFDTPTEVAALHLNTPGVLPLAGDLSDPPLTEAEQQFASAAARWRHREGFHLLTQGAAPDALAPGLNDSPAGLAAWLVDKYRRWSDCGGEIERRFSKDDVCDFLTAYWATQTIASSMRLYATEARNRWRLETGERIEVPCAIADFPAEILRPPRAWSERVLADLRRWTEFDRGGHFAAFEEPELLAEDLIEFLAGLA